MSSRVETLKKEITKHNKAYWSDDKPEISDTEYDRLVRELTDIAPDDDFLKQLGEETVEDDVMESSFEKIQHPEVMLSLDKAYTRDEYEHWRSGKRDIIAMAKMDGLAIRLVYVKDGDSYVLKQAVTRGKKKYGFDVTENVKMIKDIPQWVTVPNYVKVGKTFEVRGEIYMKKSVFKKLVSQGQKLSNCRNAASGAMKQKDLKIVRDRNLNFFAYNANGIYEDDLTAIFAVLEKISFKVVPCITVLDSDKGGQLAFNTFVSQNYTYDFDVDGVVFMLREIKDFKKLGNTSHHPRGAISWKFESENAQTVLKNVRWQVSRTGQINPVGEYDPTEVEGAVCTKATLHNLTEFKRLKIGVGDTIEITRRGGVIPKILKVIKSKGKGITIPKKCPECGSASEVRKSEKSETETLHCTNFSCPAVTLTQILHFVSVMEIDGIGESLINQLLQEKMIKNAADLYDLKISQLENLERMGKKSAQNKIDAINASRNRPLNLFLTSLGIHTLGRSVGELLAENFETLDTVLGVPHWKLMKIEGIGPEIADNVVSGLESGKKLITALRKHIKIKEGKMKQSSGGLSGKSFLITGTLSVGRKEFQKLIEANGGDIKSAVSKTLDYLVVGDSPGSKVDKAKKAGVEIIDEEEFRNLI